MSSSYTIHLDAGNKAVKVVSELLNCMNGVWGWTYRDYFLRWLLSVYTK